MKYGCCVNTLPRAAGSIGMKYASALKQMGYDYIELPLREVARLEESRFQSVLEHLEALQLPCRCCNDFMPSSFQIVGESVTPWGELEAYLSKALKRVERLEARYAVFGSPWSRGCPDGFSKERGFQQIAEFLYKAGNMAAEHGVTIAVEHNNHEETNMLNHFADGVAMAKAVDHTNVKVLCDYYHLRFEGDSPQVLLDGGDMLVHTHIAQLEGRRYLTDLENEPMLPEYGGVLTQIGYQGGVSVEGRVADYAQWELDARVNLELLKRFLR